MGRSSSPGSTFCILPAAYGLGAGIATGTIPATLSFTPLIVIKQEQQDKYSNKSVKDRKLSRASKVCGRSAEWKRAHVGAASGFIFSPLRCVGMATPLPPLHSRLQFSQIAVEHSIYPAYSHVRHVNLSLLFPSQQALSLCSFQRRLSSPFGLTSFSFMNRCINGGQCAVPRGQRFNRKQSIHYSSIGSLIVRSLFSSSLGLVLSAIRLARGLSSCSGPLVTESASRRSRSAGLSAALALPFTLCDQ